MKKICALAVVGCWLLVGSHAGAFDCHSDAAFTVIGYGDFVTCSIESLGDTDVYHFPGSVGDRVFITASPDFSTNLSKSHTTIDPCVELVAPNGATVSEACTTQEGGQTLDTTINQTGTFSIIIEQNDQLIDSTGPYMLELSCLTGSCAPPTNPLPNILNIDDSAPDNSLTIAGNGRVGLRTNTPRANLHIFGLANQDVFNGIGPDPELGPAFNFGYSGSSFGRGSGFFNVRPDAFATGINPALYFATQNLVRMVITKFGQVGIGTFLPTQALDVIGNVRASGGFISGGTFLNVPDYVFKDDYALMPLEELQVYLKEERHLPEIPSAVDIKADGVNLGEFQMALLKKVEELTLYTLAQEQTLQEQQQTIQVQASTITDLQAQGGSLAALQDTITALTARLVALEQARP